MMAKFLFPRNLTQASLDRSKDVLDGVGRTDRRIEPFGEKPYDVIRRDTRGMSPARLECVI